MATTQFKGNPVHTSGTLPQVRSKAPNFVLVRKDLSEATLDTFQGKKKLLNIFPSLDTSVCALTVKKFYQKAGERNDLVVLNISRDLPFAQGRFCTAEGISKAEVLSAFRSSFPKDYGIEMVDGPLKGLCARAIIVLNDKNEVLYTELVPEITQEPNYDKALSSV
jgi:thiol peroxidase